MKRIAIIGAGLVGSLAAVYMARRGYHVDVYEQRKDPRTTTLERGRSINLTLSNRGWHALKVAGLASSVLELTMGLSGRTIHQSSGVSKYQPYGGNGESLHTLSRHALNLLLVNAATGYENVNFLFEKRFIDMDSKKAEITTTSGESQPTTTITYDHILGCDGAYSVVREKLCEVERCDFKQERASVGYKELVIPSQNGKYALDEKSFHVWPRGSTLFVAMANKDKSFTCSLFMPWDGPKSFATLEDPLEVENFFKEEFPEAYACMPNLLQEYTNNPTSALLMTSCSKWHYKDKVLLLGDSCHAILPFYGQGMNAGFEDVRLFDEMLTKKGDWESAVEQFVTTRRKDTDAIAKLTLDNFQELSTHTNDWRFLVRKQIERRFSERHPDLWKPLYELISFTDTPYSEAATIGKQQREIMDKIMQREDIQNTWDSEEVEQEILSMLDETTDNILISKL